jgi:hypothetical protein
MKVLASLICHGHEPFLKYVLENLYGLVDGIIVTEGVIKEYWDEPETSYTRDIIDELDKDKKILYTYKGKVNDREDMTEYNLKVALEIGKEGDWQIAMGADEAWFPGAIEFLRGLPMDIVWVGFPLDNFVGDFRHILSERFPELSDPKIAKFCDAEGRTMVNGLYHERAFRIGKGFSYFDNHTALRDSAGRYVYADGHYSSRRLYVPLLEGLLRWVHYGYVCHKDWAWHRRLYFYYRWDEQGLPLEQAKEVCAREDGYWVYLSTGLTEKFGDRFFVKEVLAYPHPYPFDKHPWLNKSREEIFSGHP